MNWKKILELPWADFNRQLMELDDEDTVFELLTKEKETRRRTAFLIRLHMRYNKLRGIRERQELISV